MSQALKNSYGFKLLVTLIHLAFWAELGVLTRAFLGKLFELGCSGRWGPCLDGGIYFKDLPANMLGSFVIGVFAASSTLGLKNDKPLAILPRGHSWQDNFEVQIGIRTGYCGSLTTFASWQLELMTVAIEKNQWINMVVGFVVGLYAAIASYILGCHAALFVDRWVLAEREDVMEQALQYREEEMDVVEGAMSAEEYALENVGSAVEVEMQKWEPDLPVNLPALSLASMRRRSAAPRTSPLPRVHRHTSAPGNPASALAGLSVVSQSEGGLPLHSMLSTPAAAELQGSSYAAQVVVEDGIGAQAQGPPLGKVPEGEGYREAGDGRTHLLQLPSSAEAGSAVEHAAAGREAGQATAAVAAAGAQHVHVPGSPTFKQASGDAEGALEKAADRAKAAAELAEDGFHTFMGNKTDFTTLLGLLLVTAGMAAGTGAETRHKWLRQVWLETLLGPFGCTLRWWLSRFNYKLKGAWAWFPIGTFIANMSATAIDFALQCALHRKSSSLGYWGTLVLASIQTGFCGSLSTVSTFVTEVVKFSELFPESINAYSYVVYSLVGGALLGIAIYGWAVWVPL